MPWVFFNRTRPVIGIQPWTSTDSIFTVPRERILFANQPALQAPFPAAVSRIWGAGCESVGLRIDSHDDDLQAWAAESHDVG